MGSGERLSDGFDPERNPLGARLSRVARDEPVLHAALSMWRAGTLSRDEALVRAVEVMAKDFARARRALIAKTERDCTPPVLVVDNAVELARLRAVEAAATAYVVAGNGTCDVIEHVVTWKALEAALATGDATVAADAATQARESLVAHRALALAPTCGEAGCDAPATWSDVYGHYCDECVPRGASEMPHAAMVRALRWPADAALRGGR